MNESFNTSEAARYYFVDEAGDPVLFDKRGRSIIGTPGCSRFFILGVAHLPDPVSAHRQLEELRVSLLSDPYFYGVPSMQPAENKTATCFHAKNDLAEVRREVFKLLPSLGVKFQAIVRYKNAILKTELQKREKDARHRYQPNAIYDHCTARLFRDLLHVAPENNIVLARRGKSDRIEALASAISKAEKRFEKKWNKGIAVPTHIEAASPSESTALQITDYYLWALQRLFERGEERYYRAIRNDCKLVIDADDARRNGYGVYYNNKKNLLELAKLPERD